MQFAASCSFIHYSPLYSLTGLGHMLTGLKCGDLLSKTRDVLRECAKDAHFLAGLALKGRQQVHLEAGSLWS